MSQSSDNFGTFTPADRPPADLLLKPLDGQDSIGRIYCQQCGMIFEFSQEQLHPLVTISNCFTNGSLAPEDFDHQKHFFLAKGCLVCAENPIFILQEV